jgi:hypothetical protein
MPTISNVRGMMVVVYMTVVSKSTHPFTKIPRKEGGKVWKWTAYEYAFKNKSECRSIILEALHNQISSYPLVHIILPIFWYIYAYLRTGWTEISK